MSYVTTPDPCDPWCTPKGKFDNLGGYGNYAAMRQMYLPEKKTRYIYEPKSRPCCPYSYQELLHPHRHHHHHHHRPHHDTRHRHHQKCDSCTTISHLKGQTYLP